MPAAIRILSSWPAPMPWPWKESTPPLPAPTATAKPAPNSQNELERIPREVRYPLLVNMLADGATPILPVGELEKLGYKIVVCPIESLLVAGAAIQRLIKTLLDCG